jgi:hypothetical protein
MKGSGNNIKWVGYLRKISFLFLLLPFLLVLSTVFVIDKGLADGVVSGKYFWFYGAMGLASLSVFILCCCYPLRFRFNLLDALVLLYGILSLSLSYFYHQSEVFTKQVLLLLVILLYFCFRVVLSINRISRYWLVVFLIVTALIEAVCGLRQLYGYDQSQHHLFKMTGSFFNPGPYSGYLAVITPLAFYYVLADYKVLKSRFSFRLSWFYLRWTVSILTVISVLLVLPAAMSRASWLAVSGSCGFVIINGWFILFIIC